MGKRLFVRIDINSKQIKVDKRDILQTHFLKKRRDRKVPAYPSLLSLPKYFNSDAECDSEPLSALDCPSDHSY